jgi:hypothetical protein
MDNSFDYVCSVISTMSAVQHNAQTMLWYVKFESIIHIQHELRCECGVRPPDDKSIRRL